MGTLIRILRIVFFVSALLLALLVLLSWMGYEALVNLLGSEYFVRLAGALIGVVVLSSGTLLWIEWRNNPLEET